MNGPESFNDVTHPTDFDQSGFETPEDRILRPAPTTDRGADDGLTPDGRDFLARAIAGGPRHSRAPELRSVANSIEPLFPSAADLLRGIAREMDEQVFRPGMPS